MYTFQGSSDFWEMMQFLGPKILAAILCGGLIGLERELKNKAAGIKTNMLICVGSTLFTATSIMIAHQGVGTHDPGDPTRIAAQIVSGIGFLGGGAILQSKEQIMGLTTAASIWLVAAIGVWVGMGELPVALTVTVIMLFVMVSVTFFENRFLGRKRLFKLTVHLREKSDDITRTALEALMVDHDVTLAEYRENSHGPQPEIRLSYHGRLRDHSKLVLELWKIPGILDIRQT
jgi:putative Mg2+ transporter-C (MgtC) family protein